MQAADEEQGLVSPAPAQSKRVSFFSAQGMKRAWMSETQSCVCATMVLLVLMGLCAACYFFCPFCLLGIIVVSMCLCPWIPYYNIPLYISIALFVFYLYNESTKKLVMFLQ